MFIFGTHLIVRSQTQNKIRNSIEQNIDAFEPNNPIKGRVLKGLGKSVL